VQGERHPTSFDSEGYSESLGGGKVDADPVLEAQVQETFLEHFSREYVFGLHRE
jgi:hypothetical protein